MTYKERYAPNIPFNPYLALPIKDSYKLNEGYIYSQEEHAVHGMYVHGGIDFDCSFGTPVFAAASGLAVATYHRFVIRNKDGKLRLYQGKPLGTGFGYMVQIYHNNKTTLGAGNRITQYGHLSRITKEIVPKFCKPNEKELSPDEQEFAEQYAWIRHNYGFTYTKEEKEIYFTNFSDIEKLHKEGSPYVTYVEKGQLIGNVGNTGILFGKVNSPEASDLISTDSGVPPLNTWDAPHLHFEEATRTDIGQKVERRDPFDIYLSRKWYQGKLKKTLFESI